MLLLLPPLLLLLILVQVMLRHLLRLQPQPLPKLPWLLLAPDRRLSVLAWLMLVILTPSRPQLQPRLQLLHRPLQLVSVAGQRPPMLESERLLLLLLRQLLPPLLPPARGGSRERAASARHGPGSLRGLRRLLRL